MSRKHAMYCSLVGVALAGTLFVIGCGLQAAVGPGGAAISFVIGGTRITFSFGDLGNIAFTAGQTSTVATNATSPFANTPSDRPDTATMSLPTDSVTTFSRRTAKGLARSQALPLNGTGTIRFLIAPGASDPCTSGVLLAEYAITYTTGQVAVLNEDYDLSAEAIALLLTNDISICIQITADFDGEILIGEVAIRFGGGGPDSALFTLSNTDTFENIHILLPGEVFDDSTNRLTPGGTRNVTLNNVTSGQVVTLRAGRAATVLDTADCPAIVGANYRATGQWDGFNLTCTATQDGSGGDGDDGPTPGTIIQVPVFNDAGQSDPAPVTMTVGGVDYGVVGVLYDQTPETDFVSTVPDSMSVDLDELGLESVNTIYMAIHSSFVADLPNGVDMGTLEISYAEGGSTTTVDFVLGSNTAEWAYDRPENVPVPHSLVETLYTFPTTIDSDFEYEGREYALTVVPDSSRTISCITLTIAPGSTYAAFRDAGVFFATWASQYVAAMTFEGPAGSPPLIGSCSGVVTPTEDCDSDGVCNTSCEPGEDPDCDGISDLTCDFPGNLIVNCSFEEGTDFSTIRVLQPGDTSITGWTVTRDEIDILGVPSNWDAYDGDRLLDLDGSPGVGGIQQTFSTVAGQSYLVTFAMSGNPENGASTEMMRVDVAGTSQDFSFDTTGITIFDLGWELQSFFFTAVSNQTTIEFYSLSTGSSSWGPLLDSVTVTADSTGGDGGTDAECSADGVCNEDCPADTPDPDCEEVCIADGFCNENCSDLSPDPDCTTTPAGEPRCTARSTFDGGDEAWTLTGDAEGGRSDPDFNFSGGNPGAFVSADDDVTGGTWYFQAPSKFHGNFSASYGRTLTFDLKQSSLSSQFDNRDVIMTGNGTTIWFNTASNPGTDWTAYSITLDASAGWLGNDDLPASEATIRNVLSNIEDLQIRGEYVSGADTGSLDNVVLNSDCG